MEEFKFIVEEEFKLTVEEKFFLIGPALVLSPIPAVLCSEDGVWDGFCSWREVGGSHLNTKNFHEIVTRQRW